MTYGLALHGAGDTSEAFTKSLTYVATNTGSIDWHIPAADKKPTLSDALHYSGLAQHKFAFPCWDLDKLANSAVRGGVLLGFSMGAITAMRLLHESRPDTFSALVCIAGCYSALQPITGIYRPPRRTSARILFIHGNNDRDIPPALSRECANGLLRGAHAVDYWSVPNAGHSWTELGLHTQGPVADRLVRWINTHGRGTPAP
jgi:predicted esterase